MTVRPFSIAFVLLSSLQAFAQQNQPSNTCPATEQAVREVSHQLWAAFRSRDVATWDKLVDDSYISTDDGGVRKRKQDLLAELRKPEGNIHNDTDEQSEDVRVVFTGGVAIVNFTKHWADYDKKAGISWGGTSRMARVLSAKMADGSWWLGTKPTYQTGTASPSRTIIWMTTPAATASGRTATRAKSQSCARGRHYQRLGQAGKSPNFSPASSTRSSAGKTVGWNGSFAINPAK
jgi:ketosteroid isomerase-like protein